MKDYSSAYYKDNLISFAAANEMMDEGQAYENEHCAEIVEKLSGTIVRMGEDVPPKMMAFIVTVLSQASQAIRNDYKRRNQ